ncbi:hypothetical protein Tco_1023627 [Tanacetum coccineum]
MGVLVVLLDVINGPCYLRNSDLACGVAVQIVVVIVLGIAGIIWKDTEGRKEYAAAGTVKQNYVSILLMLLRLRQAYDHPLLVKGCNSDTRWKSSLDKAKKLPPEKRTGLLKLLGSFFSNLQRMQLHINYGYGLLETSNGQIG